MNRREMEQTNAGNIHDLHNTVVCEHCGGKCDPATYMRSDAIFHGVWSQQCTRCHLWTLYDLTPVDIKAQLTNQILRVGLENIARRGDINKLRLKISQMENLQKENHDLVLELEIERDQL